MGSTDASGPLTPTNSVIQDLSGDHGSYTDDASNSHADPMVVAPFDTTLAFQPWRENVNFVGSILVAQNLPPTLLTGDYHLVSGSPPADRAAPSKVSTPFPPTPVTAPTTDYDGQTRSCGAYPGATACDAGADELGSAPVAAFPRTSVLDGFNRSNAAALGGLWTEVPDATEIDGNAVLVTGTGNAWWASTAKFGANQEAFFTFTQVSSTGTEQGLLLKFSGANPNGANATWIEVAYNGAGGVAVRIKDSGGIRQRGALISASFATGDQLGARTLADGTVLVYKNGVQIGSRNVTSGANPWSVALASGKGRIGVRFAGTTVGNPARFDNFGGGTMP
jgi:hypothetical protein